MNRQLLLAAALLAAAEQIQAQGIIINKTDGTFDYYPAEQVSSIVTYGYDEAPQPGQDGVQTFTVGDVSFKMVSVEGGTFQMGYNNDWSHTDCRPKHEVTVSSFSIGETEVTQALWYAVMEQRPVSGDYYQWVKAHGLGDDHPAYYVSWEDCQEFVAKLSLLTGQQFRLPTEAEWEFAARGGTKSKGYENYSGSEQIGEVGWHQFNTEAWDGSTAPTREVAQKKANELGLYDMTGNVSEWCQDWYGSYSSAAQTDPKGPETGTYKVHRGGDRYTFSLDCMVYHRAYASRNTRNTRIGLRLAL